MIEIVLAALLASVLLASLAHLCSRRWFDGEHGTFAIVAVCALIPWLAWLVYDERGLAVGAGLDVQLAPGLEQLATVTEQSQRQLVAAELSSLLEAHPGSVERREALGFLQAQLYSLQARHGDAMRVYQRLVDSGGEGAIAAESYLAQAMYFAAGERFEPSVMLQLERALGADAGNPLANSLAGIAAFQRKEYEEAKRFWLLSIKHYPPMSPQARVLQQSIAAAEDRLGGVEDAGPLASVRVRIEIDPGQRETGDSADVPVFVFARPVGGGMPLAAKRLTLGALPAEVTLSERDAMTSVTLAAVGRVELVACLSRSGQPTPSPGDSEGVVRQPVPVQREAVGKLATHQLRIDTRLE